eukprot:9396146-Pyramimonas_sp.AAC.1
MQLGVSCRVLQQPQHPHLPLGWKKLPNLIICEVLFTGQDPVESESSGCLGPQMSGVRGPSLGMAGANQ